MVENPLAFEFSKTRTICDAFDEAWAFLQGLGSDLTEPSNSLATQTILAKRIIEMADQGLTDVPELRDDALAFLQHNPPFRVIAKGSTGATAVSLAELVANRLRHCERLRRPFSRGGWNALRPVNIAHRLHVPLARQRRVRCPFRPRQMIGSFTPY